MSSVLDGMPFTLHARTRVTRHAVNVKPVRRKNNYGTVFYRLSLWRPCRTGARVRVNTSVRGSYDITVVMRRVFF